MLLLLALGDAVAQQIAVPPPATEEVVVFGDPFARWDGTRWWVESAWVHPLGVDLRADDNLQFDAGAMRVRAVLGCEIDSKLGQNQREVMCQFEDVALQAIALQDWVSTSVVEDVIEQIDAKLSGASIQLQVDAKGGVTDVDLEGLSNRNRKGRVANEQIRQIARQLVSTFHLRVKPGDEWIERNSAVHQLPSPTGTQGSSTLNHRVDELSGQWVVQTAGSGLASVPVKGDITTSMVANLDAWMAKPEGVIVRLMPRNTEDPLLDIDAAWSLETTGVGLVDPELGFVVERVSMTTGTPTAQNPVQQPLWHHGRLRMLDALEHPALGPTGPGEKAP